MSKSLKSDKWNWKGHSILRVITLTLLLGLFTPLTLSAQQPLRISGRVTFSNDGKPIPGAIAMVRSIANGAASHVNGIQTLKAPSGSTSSFIFQGYVTLVVAAGRDTKAQWHPFAARISKGHGPIAVSDPKWLCCKGFSTSKTLTNLEQGHPFRE